MLQQTRVTTAIPRYERFLREFPDIRSLAAAEPERVCESWAGLGYYQRARNLQAAARQMMEEHDGAVPEDLAALGALPGIGRYTTGAIASIAFGAQVAAVDANATRVIARLFAIGGAPARRSTTVDQIATALAQAGSAAAVNQALMDLGALVCRPQRPDCPSCPLRPHCTAYRRGTVARYPIRSLPAVRRTLSVAFAWIETDGALWLERRSPEGLWAGLWQLPGCEGPGAARRLARRVGSALGRPQARIRHELTHRRVLASVYVPKSPSRLTAGPTLRSFTDPLSVGLSTLARRAILATAGSRLPLAGRPR
jgi:A/G-specific adenine glycosylase